jgi:hypothetical protein
MGLRGAGRSSWGTGRVVRGAGLSRRVHGLVDEKDGRASLESSTSRRGPVRDGLEAALSASFHDGSLTVADVSPGGEAGIESREARYAAKRSRSPCNHNVYRTSKAVSRIHQARCAADPAFSPTTRSGCRDSEAVCRVDQAVDAMSEPATPAKKVCPEIDPRLAHGIGGAIQRTIFRKSTASRAAHGSSFLEGHEGAAMGRSREGVFVHPS